MARTLKIEKFGSGRRLVFDADGKALGDFSLDDLMFDDDELGGVVSRHEAQRAARTRTQVQLSELVNRRMNESGISYRQALCEVGREQPELARRYRAEVLGIRQADKLME